METLTALLAICAGNSPAPGEFPAQRPVTRSIDDLRLNKRLIEQTWGWWFDMLSRQLWRHCNATENKMTTGEDLAVHSINLVLKDLSSLRARGLKSEP